MTIVCLDTQLIQWGVAKRASHPNVQKFITPAVSFINWLDKQKADVIVPSIIVGELLVPLPPSERLKLLSQLSTDWIIVDYDLRSAQLFAEMRYDHSMLEIVKDIKANNPYATRKQLVADIMIIATAIAHGAEKIYTHDNDFIKMALGYIAAENFLNIPLQFTLPDES